MSAYILSEMNLYFGAGMRVQRAWGEDFVLPGSVLLVMIGGLVLIEGFLEYSEFAAVKGRT
jgi:hypothetical protein